MFDLFSFESTPPDLMALDFEILIEGLIFVVVYAIVIERALSPIFESQWFIDKYYEPGDGTSERKKKPKAKGLKESISIVVSIAFTSYVKFDIIAVINQNTDWTVPGLIISGLLIAGGSKGSIKLFSDILDFKSSAEKARKEGK